MKFLSVLILASTCLVTVPELAAQQLSISGVVQDPTGVIPGARITLRDPIGKSSQTISDGSGAYRFEGLRPGAYELEVRREGFSPQNKSLNLAGESRTVDISLEIASILTSIDVTDVVGRGTASGMEVENR